MAAGSVVVGAVVVSSIGGVWLGAVACGAKDVNSMNPTNRIVMIHTKRRAL